MSDSDITTTTTRITSFGGLASIGITADFRQTRNGLVIFRSPWDLVVISVALIGMSVATIYYAGAEDIELLLAGDFGGDRIFVAVGMPLIIIIAILFIKSSVLRRPRATVSRITRTIDYVHPGYDQQRIEASRITGIAINLRRDVSIGAGKSRQPAYAVTLSLPDNQAVDIATFRSEHKAEALMSALTTTLGIRR